MLYVGKLTKFIETIYDEILEFQWYGRYDSMYQRKERNGASRYGREGSIGQFVRDYDKMLIVKYTIYTKYIEKLYDKENRFDDIELEYETDVDDDEKGPSNAR